METAGSVETEAADRAASRLRTLADAVAVGLLPLFVVSQWLALRWEASTRFWFNAVFGVVFVVFVVAGWERIPRWLRWLGFAHAAILVISWLVNGVDAPVVIRGSLPYAVPVVALAAGYAVPPSRRGRGLARWVHLGLAATLAVVATLQLWVGEAAFRWFGQDLAYPRWWERGRATGLVVNPGRLAHVGLLITALAPRGPAVAVAIGLGAVIVATSGGRIGLFGAAVLAFAGVAVWQSPARRALWGAAAAIGAVLVVILALSPATRNDFLARTEATIDDVTDADQLIDDTRIASLEAGVEAWRSAPLIGWGPGRFGSTTAWATRSELHERFGLPDLRSQEFQAALLAAGDEREIDVGNAQLDVGFLQALAETGVLGLAALLALLAGGAVEAVRRDRPEALALIGLIALFSLTGPGLADPSLTLVALWWAGSTVAS